MIPLVGAKGIGIIVAFFTLICASRAIDTNAVIDSIIANQGKITTWHAEFVQVRHLPSLKKPLKTPGKVWFRNTGEFRWELGKPARSIAIRSPKQITILSPRLKLAEVYPLDSDRSGPWRDALALLEVGFPRSRAKLEEKFVLNGVVEIVGGTRVHLVPRQKTARQFLSDIQMDFGNDHSLVASEMTFSHGARIRTEFTRSRLNPEIDASRFDDSIGSEYEVSRPLSGR